MGKVLWISLLLAMTAAPAHGTDPSLLACLNSYSSCRDIRFDGTVGINQVDFPIAYVDPYSEFHQRLRERWLADLEMLKRKFEKSGSFKHESDYGLALLHNGKPAEALAIFERLAKEHPEEYAIASNLGTAYELNGDNRNAREWIAKAMEMHSGSHEGTEWLHIKILDAKIALESDPEWLRENSVLGVDFGSGKTPKWPDAIKESAGRQKEILDALRYQLKERVQFVKPKDPVVAQLLWDLSSVVGLKYSAVNAQSVLEVAEKYADETFAEQIARRNRYYAAFVDRSSFGIFRRHPAVSTFMIMTLLVLIAILASRKLKEIQGSPP